MTVEERFEDYQAWAEKQARHFVKQARLPKHLLDEMINTALIGLWTAATRFEDGKGRFTPFARLHVRGAMLDELPRCYGPMRIPRSVRMEKTAVGFESLVTAREQQIWKDDFEAIDQDDLIQHLFGPFQGRDRVILDRMASGYQLCEIADEVGVSDSRMSKLKRELLSKIAERN